MPNNVIQLHKQLGCYLLRKQTCYSQTIEEMVSVDFFPVSAGSSGHPWKGSDIHRPVGAGSGLQVPVN